MLRAKFKKFFKESPLIFNILVGIVFLYIKFCYLTIRWKFTWPKEYSEKDLLKEKGALFAIWHSELVYAIRIFGKYTPIKALASPHSDGKILGKLINLFGYETIEGSTNRGATIALKAIINDLKSGVSMVITPDGPRGPAKQINSSIARIAHKYDRKLFAATCKPASCFRLNSWDEMMIPKPFSKVYVKFSAPITLSGDVKKDNALLAEKLNNAN